MLSPHALCPVTAAVSLQGASAAASPVACSPLSMHTFLSIKTCQAPSSLSSGPVCQWRIAVDPASKVLGLVKQEIYLLFDVTEFLEEKLTN